MGKRKNRHCNSKREVIERYRRQQAEKQNQEPPIKARLREANHARAAVERARKQMQEKNRRESKNDID